MRDDIFGGLRNALEHGSTLEQGIRSFINAGYPESEVREAAKSLEGGAATMALQSPARPSVAPLTKAPAVAPPQLQRQAQPMRQPTLNQTSFEVHYQKQPPSLLIIILSFILLLSIAGFVFSLLFKKEIAEFLAKLLSG